MSTKQLIWVGAIAGSTVGGLLPGLWHASFLSMSGVVLSAVGGVVGIWVAWKLANR